MQVTQPYHDASGAVIYKPGDQFDQGADLPDDLRVRPVIVEARPPARKHEDEPVKSAKPAPGHKGA